MEHPLKQECLLIANSLGLACRWSCGGRCRLGGCLLSGGGLSSSSGLGCSSRRSCLGGGLCLRLRSTLGLPQQLLCIRACSCEACGKNEIQKWTHEWMSRVGSAYSIAFCALPFCGLENPNASNATCSPSPRSPRAPAQSPAGPVIPLEPKASSPRGSCCLLLLPCASMPRLSLSLVPVPPAAGPGCDQPSKGRSLYSHTNLHACTVVN